MRRFFTFLHNLFTPKFRFRFITPAGVRVEVTCTYGSEKHFKEIVTQVFPFIEATEITSYLDKHNEAEKEENVNV